MGSSVPRPSFEDPALHREIMRLRQVDNHTNLLFLILEYLSLALVFAAAVVFAEYRQSWGLSWSWRYCRYLLIARGADRRRPASVSGSGA